MIPPDTVLTAPGQCRLLSTAEADSRRPVMVRVPESILPRIDRAAKRLGLSRAALMLLATIEKLERMEGQ